MRRTPPIYTDQGKTYHIDTCGPQIRAIEEGKIVLHALSHGHYPGHPISRREDLAGLSSIGFWDAVTDQDWGLEMHRNEGIEMTYLETGEMPCTVDGEDYRLVPGDFTITRPWQAHLLGDPKIRPGRLHWFIIDVKVRRPNQEWHWPKWVVLSQKDIEELTLLLRRIEHPRWHGAAGIRSCFQKIARAIVADDHGSQVSHLAVYLNEVLLLLLETLRACDESMVHTLSFQHRTVEAFLNDLRTNPESLAHPWTLDTMAEHCGMGATSFVKFCRGVTNTTPIQYLAQCRVEAAAHRLLGSPDAKITDIAFGCGFASSQYFATVFRALKGCGPREFRARNQATVSNQ
jgi:AraC family transcriptional regulator, 4-hydroxyphenylacetate 3-monooxygenase operon regulatory protein